MVKNVAVESSSTTRKRCPDSAIKWNRLPSTSRAVANEYEWPDYRPIPRKSAPLDPEVLAGYAGAYRAPRRPDSRRARGSKCAGGRVERHGDVDMSRYSAIIVPGAQPHNDFYPDYIRHAGRFDDFVAKGGTLILELNGAENTAIVLPRGVTMASNAGLENAILAPNHPIFAPLGNERVIRANAASHGYLSGIRVAL